MPGSLRTTRETGLLSGRFYHTTKNNGKGIRTLAPGRTYAACPAATYPWNNVPTDFRVEAFALRFSPEGALWRLSC
jgi:hypothetical protein